MTRSLRSILLSLFTLALFIVPTLAEAQVTPAAGYTPPDDTQSIKVGATIFWDYGYQKLPKTTDAAGNSISPNAFNVGRTYINVTGNISHSVQFRITPDIARVSGSGTSLNGSYGFRLKYGYGQFNIDSTTWKQTWVRAGLQQTTFVDTEEGVYRYRFQGSIFVDRDAGVSSSDLGVSFHTSLPNNYGDIHVGLYNGEGYTAPEANNQKSLQARVTLRPFAKGPVAARGFRAGIYVNRDKTVKGADRNKWIAHSFYEHTRFNAGFDYFRGETQTLPTSAEAKADGYTVWATPFFQTKGDGLEGLVRYDSWRADRSGDARRNRMIAGLAYWFPHPGGAGSSAILLDYEQVTFANFTTSQAKQQRITLHGLINF